MVSKTIASLQYSEDPEESENEAHYFEKHCRRKLDFETIVERWIHNARSVPEKRGMNVVHENKRQPDVSSRQSGDSEHLDSSRLSKH